MCIMNLPKKYLSYSQYALWKKNRDQYRARYYENAPPFETAETIFGKNIAETLEDKNLVEKHPVLSLIPRYSEPEYSVKVEIEGIPLMGYLDSYDPEGHAICEYKTGHLSIDGKVPWNDVKVAKHEQLPFYSLLIKTAHGKVDPKVKLVWIETKFKNKNIEFNGNTLTSQTRELELTGKFQVFERHIYKWELDKMKENIIKVAKEIHEDFTAYQQVYEKDSKTIPSEKPEDQGTLPRDEQTVSRG